jgi:hypothetical protein
MRKIQQITFSSILALALSATAFAGDISVGKSAAIGGGKTIATQPVSLDRAGDISVGLVNILEGLISIIL